MEDYTTKAAESDTQERLESHEDTLALISEVSGREETRVEQIEDLTKFQKFKKWAKENLAGLSAAVIAVAGIITTVVVEARKAVLQGERPQVSLQKPWLILQNTHFKHHQHVAVVGCEGHGMAKQKPLSTVRGRSRATVKRN